MKSIQSSQDIYFSGHSFLSSGLGASMPNLCRSVGPSVSRKMSKIVKIQEFALEQKTKVNEHVE